DRESQRNVDDDVDNHQQPEHRRIVLAPKALRRPPLVPRARPSRRRRALLHRLELAAVGGRLVELDADVERERDISRSANLDAMRTALEVQLLEDPVVVLTPPEKTPS